jgi:hypothetical protein
MSTDICGQREWSIIISGTASGMMMAEPAFFVGTAFIL